jgi:hypothetical protein
VRVELVPPEVEREGLDAFEQIGSETREVIERRPASAVVVEVVRRIAFTKAPFDVTPRYRSSPQNLNRGCLKNPCRHVASVCRRRALACALAELHRLAAG